MRKSGSNGSKCSICRCRWGRSIGRRQATRLSAGVCESPPRDADPLHAKPPNGTSDAPGRSQVHLSAQSAPAHPAAGGPARAPPGARRQPYASFTEPCQQVGKLSFNSSVNRFWDCGIRREPDLSRASLKAIFPQRPKFVEWPREGSVSGSRFGRGGS